MQIIDILVIYIYGCIHAYTGDGEQTHHGPPSSIAGNEREKIAKRNAKDPMIHGED